MMKIEVKIRKIPPSRIKTQNFVTNYPDFALNQVDPHMQCVDYAKPDSRKAS